PSVPRSDTDQRDNCRGRHGNEGPGGATAGDDRKMNNGPLEREPIDRVRARLEALLKANAAPRCGARSKRTGKPCRGAALPHGSCKLHGGKSTWATHDGGPRAQQAGKLETRALFAGSQGGTVAPAGGNTCAPLSVPLDLKAPSVPRSDTDHGTIYLTGIDANGKVASPCRRVRALRLPPAG